MMLFMDGFNDCIAGVVRRFGQEPIVCYDREKVIKKLMADGDMDQVGAEDYFEYNQIGAWAGEGTPCFLTYMTVEEIEEMDA